MDYTRISADCHIDMPWIPPDLFTANASAAMRDRMPYVTDGPDGPCWTARNGASFGLVGGVGPSGQKYVPGLHYRVDVMASTGLYDDGRKGVRRPTDPHLRVKDMERDGVQAEIIFGILGAATRLRDHEAAAEMFRPGAPDEAQRLLAAAVQGDVPVRPHRHPDDPRDRRGHADVGLRLSPRHGAWPESSKYNEEQFGHLPAGTVRKIVCENAGKFYGLIT